MEKGSFQDLLRTLSLRAACLQALQTPLNAFRMFAQRLLCPLSLLRVIVQGLKTDLSLRRPTLQL